MARGVTWSELGVVTVGKALLSSAVLAAGFVALSDDDFSRIVIAEQFAHAPSLDPSGTSWLPLPFFIQGAAMKLFGRSLATAHVTDVVLGIVSALCIHRAARWLRVSRAGSVLAALIASGILTAARLGVSAQPEALTAGLVTLGAASTRVDGSRRVLGACALFAACLCRYEPWAAAAVFTLMTAYDALRRTKPRTSREVLHSGFMSVDAERGYGESEPPGPHDVDSPPPRERPRATLLVAAVIAVLAPLLWLVHGVVTHHDALFFFHRVAAYRRALGVSESLGRSLLAYPALLFRAEPEVTLAAILVLRIAADRAPRALSRLVRPGIVVLGMFVFLVVGRVLDGAPTHHAERTLLPLWTFFAMLVAEGIVRTVAPVRGQFRGDAVARLVPVGAVVVLVSVLLRSGRAAESDASRRAECELGVAARARVGAAERLLVDTADYGYFAVIAAFGAPERTDVVDRHDPRRPRRDDPFASDALAAAFLASNNVQWFAVQAAHRARATRSGTVVATSGDLSLLRLQLR